MTLDRYLIKQLLPIFLIALLMFILLVEMIDLFTNLPRYLSYEAATADIFKASFYFLPKSFSYALPISLLFAVAYTLGSLYASNELVSVFASGIPFWRFSVSVMIIGFLASIFSFFFDDFLVIPTLRIKNELTQILLHQQRSENQSDIVVKTRNGTLIYAIDYLDIQEEAMYGVSIIEQDETGRFVSLIRTQRGAWNGDYWEFFNPIIYEWDGSDFLQYRNFQNNDTFIEAPDTFRRNLVNVEELNFMDAGLLVNDLRTAGLPFTDALADYHHRFSFASVSFVVVILSLSMCGRFRKNILLMSLLASLVTSVGFYVMEMITMMMARLSYIPPFIGAWFPVFAFVIIGVLLIRTVKT